MVFEKFKSLLETRPIQIGIDIGGSSIKMVAIRKSSNGIYELLNAVMIETPPGSFMDGIIYEVGTLAKAIQDGLKKLDIPNKKSIISVGLKGLSALYKRVKVPFESEAELGEQIILEAQQMVDSDLADWIADWQQIDKSPESGQVIVILVLAKRTSVESYGQVMKIAGSRLSVVDCDIFALQNSLEQSYPSLEGNILCIDIGKDTCKLNLIHRHKPLIIRSFSLGGGYLTEQICKSMNMSMDHAESAKISFSQSAELSQNPELVSATHQYVMELCEEFQKTIDFFSNMNEETKIDKIHGICLSGGGSLTHGLTQRLQEIWGSEIIFINPFQTLKGYDNPLPQPHLYSVALGLALRKPQDKA